MKEHTYKITVKFFNKKFRTRINAMSEDEALGKAMDFFFKNLNIDSVEIAENTDFRIKNNSGVPEEFKNIFGWK